MTEIYLDQFSSCGNVLVDMCVKETRERQYVALCVNCVSMCVCVRECMSVCVYLCIYDCVCLKRESVCVCV